MIEKYLLLFKTFILIIFVTVWLFKLVWWYYFIIETFIYTTIISTTIKLMLIFYNEYAVKCLANLRYFKLIHLILNVVYIMTILMKPSYFSHDYWQYNKYYILKSVPRNNKILKFTHFKFFFLRNNTIYSEKSYLLHYVLIICITLSMLSYFIM